MQYVNVQFGVTYFPMDDRQMKRFATIISRILNQI